VDVIVLLEMAKLILKLFSINWHNMISKVGQLWNENVALKTKKMVHERCRIYKTYYKESTDKSI
jgi:hypothetical protein